MQALMHKRDSTVLVKEEETEGGREEKENGGGGKEEGYGCCGAQARTLSRCMPFLKLKGNRGRSLDAQRPTYTGCTRCLTWKGREEEASPGKCSDAQAQTVNCCMLLLSKHKGEGKGSRGELASGAQGRTSRG